MDIPVLIEPVPGSGFRAPAANRLRLSSRAPLQKMHWLASKTALRRSSATGRVWHPFELYSEHPWAKSFGIFDESDPLVQEWLRIIEENRSRPEELE